MMASRRLPPLATGPSAAQMQAAAAAAAAAARHGAASCSEWDAAAAAAQQPNPLILPLLVVHATIQSCCLLQMLGHWAASVRAAPPGSPPWGSAGYLIISLFVLFTLVFLFDGLLGMLTKRFTNRQLLDRCLVSVAGVILTFQTLLTLFHPPFLAAEKNWAAFAAYQMGNGVLACGFPPAYSLVQWLMLTACLTALDCYAHCSRGQQQCPDHALGPLACCLPRGLLIGASGLAAWMTAYVLFTKSSARLHRQAESMTPRGRGRGEEDDALGELPEQEQQPGASSGSRAAGSGGGGSGGSGGTRFRRFGSGPAPMPFESYRTVPPAATRFFLWLDRTLTALAEGVNEEVLVRAVCLPIMFYSLGFCFLARMKLQGVSFCSMSPDTFLLYTMAWFMVGRNSLNFDLGALEQRIQAVAAAAAATFARSSQQPSLAELVERLRQHVTGGGRPGAAPGGGQHITVTELLGEGAFGKVYKGVWRGTSVAVKRMVLPGDLKRSERRERMAIMEAAISGALVHPNIVQTYTYTVQSVPAGVTAPREVHVGDTLEHVGDTLEHVPGLHASGSGRTPNSEPPTTSGGAEALEVQLVLEYMDCGTLRDVLDDGCFECSDDGCSDGLRPSVNYYAVLETAADVAKGMMHLHSLNVIHCDLKARNVLLRSCASDPRSFSAKVGDFGLSLQLDSGQACVDCFQGTPTHMAPEVHRLGRQSKAGDVFSFGITMWELYTGGRAFQAVGRDLLGHYIAVLSERPHFPPHTPHAYASLAARCWDPDPEARPRFEEVVELLLGLIPAESADTVPVPVTVLGAQVTVFRPLGDAPLGLPLLPLAIPAAAGAVWRPVGGGGGGEEIKTESTGSRLHWRWR